MKYKTLNVNTLKAKNFIDCYIDSVYEDVIALYKKPSNTKITAFNAIYYSVPEDCRHTIKVWGNNNFFTVGFKSYDDYYIITRYNSYYIPYVM